MYVNVLNKHTNYILQRLISSLWNIISDKLLVFVGAKIISIWNINIEIIPIQWKIHIFHTTNSAPLQRRSSNQVLCRHSNSVFYAEAYTDGQMN